ncbi:hypothetical protein GCM10022403_018500 [Streptomyces coacervatus]|uniref:Integral membrane protein n=1 Tax=Streptomyces coacervatus TaxID=647381 RepID=A0ABP7H465_9ACTN|nr:hypothetical protein [Streptomyces coacervatus]MDF2271531.1 hypothetical protein [Streptomyces coacervatus]
MNQDQDQAAQAAQRNTPSAADDESELQRLRAELAELRARIGGEQRRRSRLLVVRRVVAALLVALVAVLAVTSVVGVWGARTTLNTGRWVATVGPLPKNPAVNAAVSTYLTDQIFDQLNVQQRLSEALPPRASFLAAPVTGAVHDYMKDTVSKLIRTEQFQALWRATNRSAHARIVAVLEKRNENVRVGGETVTLNLLPMVNNALNALEDGLPTLFGKKPDLPELSSGQLPPGLHDRIEKALGVNLPDDFAQVRLYNRQELGQLQDAVVLFKRGLVGLLIGTVLLLALALWISPDRRRSVLQLGLWLVVCTVVLSSVLRAVRDQILGQVPDGVYRDGVRAVLWTVFTTLRERGDQLLVVGVATAVVAYLVGPGRLPVGLRRYSMQGARATGRFAANTGRRLTRETDVSAWIRDHADVLRVCGIAAAALCALLLSSWTGLLVVALVLAAYEVTVTLLARGAPSPAAGEAPAKSPQQTDTAR